MVFLGALLGGYATTTVVHRDAIAWTQIWAMNARMLSIRVGLQQLRAELLPVLVCGCAPWEMGEDVLCTATSAAVRTTHIMMHGRCQAGENCVERHRRVWVPPRPSCRPVGLRSATALVACAAGGVATLSARPACSVVGRALRCTPTADVQCFRPCAGWHLGAVGRRRRVPLRRQCSLVVEHPGLLDEVVAGLLNKKTCDEGSAALDARTADGTAEFVR